MLGELLELKSNAVNLAKYIRAGGLVVARRMLRDMKLPALDAEIEEVRRQVAGAFPAAEMVGGARYMASDRMYKFHWPQVAWNDLLQVGVRGRARGRSML